ncbi:LOB domain-containing protein 22-like [Dorcoceras hygrometricum]|uniref:LOB domain-containing protein 22-like n=1 Tax=Dorcoceras hygrometricum TaxID=472368 RepID=A0A2Z7BZ45_9LAMI|nr:LOB domain-containing protein 22-like [Dorcoceras hygrometricum]
MPSHKRSKKPQKIHVDLIPLVLNILLVQQWIRISLLDCSGSLKIFVPHNAHTRIKGKLNMHWMFEIFTLDDLVPKSDQSSREVALQCLNLDQRLIQSMIEIPTSLPVCTRKLAKISRKESSCQDDRNKVRQWDDGDDNRKWRIEAREERESEL